MIQHDQIMTMLRFRSYLKIKEPSKTFPEDSDSINYTEQPPYNTFGQGLGFFSPYHVHALSESSCSDGVCHDTCRGETSLCSHNTHHAAWLRFLGARTRL